MTAAPKADVTRYVRNRSSRGGVRPSLIVLHTTEGSNRAGLEDLRGLGSWFDNPAASASSTVANDAEGHNARYCRDEDKPWTQARYNAVSLSIEQIGFASQRFWPDAQLRSTARWIAHWSKKHGIPIRRGAVSGGAVTRSGVVQHSELGALGGGHHDCGPNYPLARVLELARAIAAGEDLDEHDPRYDLLTRGEQDAVDQLFRARRVKYRHGGRWSNVGAVHLRKAEDASDWIERRLKAIATGSREDRPKRRAYLRKVLADGKLRTA